MVDRRSKVHRDDETVAELAKRLAAHAPNGGAGIDLQKIASEMIFEVFVSPTGLMRAWDAEAELTKLEKMAHLAHELAATYHSVHQLLKIDIESEIQAQGVFDGYAFKDASTSLHNLTVRVVPDFVTAAVMAGKLKAQKAMPPARQRHWEGVSLIYACRRAWPIITGENAPMSLNDAAPFAGFLRDVFDCLKIKSDPRSIMDSWREVQSYEKNS